MQGSTSLVTPLARGEGTVRYSRPHRYESPEVDLGVVWLHGSRLYPEDVELRQDPETLAR